MTMRGSVLPFHSQIIVKTSVTMEGSVPLFHSQTIVKRRPKTAESVDSSSHSTEADCLVAGFSTVERQKKTRSESGFQGMDDTRFELVTPSV
jgi:hypothetical protein